MSRIMSRPIIPGQKPDRPSRPAGNLWAEGSGGAGDRPQLSTLRRSPQRAAPSRDEASQAPLPEQQAAASGRGPAATHVRAPRLNAASVGRQETVAAQILEENKLALASLVATRRTGSTNTRHMSPMSRVATSHRPQQSEELGGGSDGNDCVKYPSDEGVGGTVETGRIKVASLHPATEDGAAPRAAVVAATAVPSVTGHPTRSVSAPKSRGGDRQLDRCADGGRTATPQRLPNRAFLAVSSAFRSGQPSAVPQPDLDLRPSTPPERCVRSPYRSVDVSPLRRIDGPPRASSPFRLTQLPLEIPELPHIARPARSSSPGFAQHDGPHQRKVAEAASLHKPSLSPARVDLLAAPAQLPVPMSHAPVFGAVGAAVRNAAPEGDTLLSSQSSSSGSPSIIDSQSPPSRVSTVPSANTRTVVPTATSTITSRVAMSHPHSSHSSPPGGGSSGGPPTANARTVLKFSFPSGAAVLRAVPEEVHRAEVDPSINEMQLAASGAPPAAASHELRFCWSCGAKHPDRSAVEHTIRFCCACGAKVTP